MKVIQSPTVSPNREEMLMGMQRSFRPSVPLGMTEGYSPTVGKTDVKVPSCDRKPSEKVMEIIDGIDNGIIFRWFHVPFVVAELIWDRLDGAAYVITSMGLDGLKKHMREARNIRREVCSIRNAITKGMFGDYAERSAQTFLDSVEDSLSEYYHRIVTELKDRFGLSGDMLCMVGAVHEALLLYEAVNRYAGIFRKFMMKEYRLETRSPMPSPFFQMGTVLRSFAPEHVLDFCKGGVMDSVCDDMVNMMYNVEMYDDEGMLVKTDDRLGKFVSEIKRKEYS